MNHKELVNSVRFEGNVYRFEQYKSLRRIRGINPSPKQEKSKFLTDRERVAKNRRPITFGGR